MTHSDHVQLIRNAITSRGGLWADLGSGWGAFTLALRDLAGESIKIFSVDMNQSSLNEQKSHFEDMFPGSDINFIETDFTKPLNLPALDGIMMANSLHFIENQSKFLSTVRSYLKPSAKVVIVEYDSDKGNRWVPYPLKFDKLKQVGEKVGFKQVAKVGETDSTWLNGMYCAELIC